MNEYVWTLTIEHDGITHTERVVFTNGRGTSPDYEQIQPRLQNAARIAALTVFMRHEADALAREQAAKYRAQHPELDR